jgi:hypothetical protein
MFDFGKTIFMLFRLRVLSSGIKSFELTNRNEKKDLQEIATLVSVRFILETFIFVESNRKVETTKSMSSDQLANQLGIPVIVARERYCS